MVAPNGNAGMDETANNELNTPGSLLRQGRERVGLTSEEVAGQLNLLPTLVRALEADQYQHFAGEIFVKGHLRAYARLLKLNPEDVLRLYRGNSAPSSSTLLGQRDVHWRPVSLNHGVSHWRRYSGIAATLVVLAGLWGWQQHRDRGQMLSLTAETASELGGIDSALNSGTESALLDSVQLLPTQPTPSAPANGNSAVPTGTDAAAVAATSDIDKLSLRFSADCWIEIKDRDNKLLVATLKHADEQLQLEGRGPFKVLLGYAPGVAMAYNGTPVKVDVPEGARSTRLIVGSS
jgi:cytoskeleton protein RodZ